LNALTGPCRKKPAKAAVKQQDVAGQKASKKPEVKKEVKAGEGGQKGPLILNGQRLAGPKIERQPTKSVQEAVKQVEEFEADAAAKARKRA